MLGLENARACFRNDFIITNLGRLRLLLLYLPDPLLRIHNLRRLNIHLFYLNRRLRRILVERAVAQDALVTAPRFLLVDGAAGVSDHEVGLLLGEVEVEGL